MAAVLDDDPDSTDLHLADTLAAGAGLCDADAVRVLVDEGPARVHELIALGGDLRPRRRRATWRWPARAATAMPRVVHAGGAATGAEVERALVGGRPARPLRPSTSTRSRSTCSSRAAAAAGVTALTPAGAVAEVRARHVLLATGGAGQVFAVTTNPLEATGDGIAMALRAGVAVADIEFVQFHPTALHHPAMPRPLLSEALRGHGALLRDADGRAVRRRAAAPRQGEPGDHGPPCSSRTSTTCGSTPPGSSASPSGSRPSPPPWPRSASTRPATGCPIAPAAHYLCGGVVTDLDGASSLPGLWAAGEVACTGVHGANRLASNSLLEGMVFGPRVVEAVGAGVEGPAPTGAMRAVMEGGEPGGVAGRALPRVLSAETVARATVSADKTLVGAARSALQQAMTTHAGVLRSEASLAEAAAAAGRAASAAGAGAGAPAAELRNLATVAAALAGAALARTETRGAHARTDFPEAEPRQRVRYIVGARPAG